MIRLIRLAAALVLALALAGCHSATGPAGLPTAACDDATRVAASAAPDPSDSTRIDLILQACTTLPDLEAAGSKYPGAFGGGDTSNTLAVATARCREAGGPAASPVCIALLATPGPS
jgi:hypothetical protein